MSGSDHSIAIHGSTALKSLVFGTFAAVTSSLFAQTPGPDQRAPREKIDVWKLGPQVGDQVPDFSLKDQNGKVWTLQSIMGPKGAMLVFVRSADW